MFVLRDPLEKGVRVTAEALLQEATALFLSLTPAQRVEAIRAFRVIRGRVEKPRTGPLLPKTGPYAKMSASGD